MENGYIFQDKPSCCRITTAGGLLYGTLTYAASYTLDLPPVAQSTQESAYGMDFKDHE
jgi:hypothetical protein